MEKIWLKSYPSYAPADVDVDAYPSLVALVDAVCARFPGRAAFANQGASITYQVLDELSRHFCAYLQQQAGVAKGDRIALMMPNLLQYPVALLGALRAGCTVVNVNPLYTARELQDQLADSGASCIVVLENFAHTLQEALPAVPMRTVITTRVGDMLHFPRALLTNFVVAHVRHMVPPWHIEGAVAFDDAIRAGAGMRPGQAQLNGSDVAFFQYTGGTTGIPKAAVLTHANMVANVLQTEAWVGGVLKQSQETAIIPLPLYHIFALTCMLTFMKIAATNVLVTDPRDWPAFVKVLKQSRPTIIIGVNTLFNALLNAPGIEQAATGTLKVAVAGGMAVQRSTAEKWQARFGVPMIEGYGLTEASPIVCANPLDSPAFTGMIGLPIPSTEVAILDDAGEELALGQLGEICVRGPQVMQGYWNKPEETAKVFTADGWLRTGDMGVMDERGYVKLLDRKKDMIVVSSFKVFPNEVEQVAAMLPGVQEVAAIPAPDEHSGEVVKLVVVKKDPALSAEQLIEHCKRYLTAYKVPKYVVFRDHPLPKSNIGKILRRVVIDEERLAGQHGKIDPEHA
ncbi:MAG: AMP-binding protein [Telluria sp.]